MSDAKLSAASAPAIVKTDSYQGADYPRGREAAARRKTIRRMVIGGVAVAVVGALANGCTQEQTATAGVPAPPAITAPDTPTMVDGGMVAPEIKSCDTAAAIREDMAGAEITEPDTAPMAPGMMPGPELNERNLPSAPLPDRR